jgi:hypothetical protein
MKSGASFVGIRYDGSGQIYIEIEYGTQVTSIDTGIPWSTDWSFGLDVKPMPGEQLPLCPTVQRTSPLSID